MIMCDRYALVHFRPNRVERPLVLTACRRTDRVERKCSISAPTENGDTLKRPFGDVSLEELGEREMLRSCAVFCNNVLIARETTTTKPHAAPEEPLADAVVETDRVRDLVGVDVELLADVPDVVDEADLACKERVVGVLDHLGSAGVGLDDRRVGRLDERVEDCLDIRERALVVGPEHDLVGVQEVVDGGPLAQELRVHTDAKPLAGGPVARGFQNGGDCVLGRAGYDRALDHDGVPVVFAGERLAELCRGRLHDRQVDAAVVVLRGRQTEEGYVGVEHGRVVGGRPEATGALGASVGGDELVEARLVDGRVAVVDRCDDLLVDIDVDDVVAEVSETGCDGGADVAASDDGETHLASRFVGTAQETFDREYTCYSDQ